jgi:AraC family transcriptional regulator, regulatory protein of adaptative response / methylated-DNA-[protein]-cysteine methyltransferase
MEPPPTPLPDAAGMPSPDEAWEAVLSRNTGFDHRFVYAVRSTGIFCLPSCASRKPRRERVVFYPSAEQATDAGFRACRRCRPDSGRPPAAVRSVERARVYLDEHLGERVTLARLAEVAHMSRYHLQRTFKRYVGLSPREYVEAKRTERLKERLRDGDTVSRATFEAGYGSPSRVYENAPAQLGMTPGEYRNGGAGTLIRFATATTPVGTLLVAATERGVCAVSLGDDEETLIEQLGRDHPSAELEPADDGLRGWLTTVVESIERRIDPLRIPLDLKASAFQCRVWQALREIPPGERRSYGQVAAAIGSPGAARAVGRACATNPVALVIPCHRVVRGDGGEGGYRWGIERKRRLLELETEQGEKE